jgi:hypothetical protein
VLDVDLKPAACVVVAGDYDRPGWRAAEAKHTTSDCAVGRCGLRCDDWARMGPTRAIVRDAS